MPAMTEEAPRWLDRKALAIHISVRVDEVRKLLRAGKLPTPSYHLGPKSPRWDRAPVDALFEGKAASDDDDQEALKRNAVQAILRDAAARPRHRGR